MNELIEKAFSAEEDINELSITEKIKYLDELYFGITNIPPSQECNMNLLEKAENKISLLKASLVFQYKNDIFDELTHRTSSIPNCYVKKMRGVKIPICIDLKISHHFIAKIVFRWSPVVSVYFNQVIVDKYGYRDYPYVNIKRKNIPECLKRNFRFTKGHFERNVTEDDWIDVIMDILVDLTKRSEEVKLLCEASTNIDYLGRVKKTYRKWKSKCKIFSLSKEYPQRHFHHAKKSEQERWDHSPNFHGSNGTYVENVNPLWALKIRINKPFYESTGPLYIHIDVHEYVTTSLMPHLGWKRMTNARCNRLNDILKGLVTVVDTLNTTAPALYRDFKPSGFQSWGDYLDSIILKRILSGVSE